MDAALHRQGSQSKPLTYRRAIKWVRDRWLINHFYGIEAAELTFPEFMDALQSITEVQKELRPKSPEEIVSMLGQQMSEMFEANRRAKQEAQSQARDN